MNWKQEVVYGFNPDCKVTHVRFRMRGEKLDPETVTKDLKLVPTHSFKKGEQYKVGTKSRTRPWGVWQLSSEDNVRSMSTQRHAEFILRKLKCRSKKLQKYLKSEDYFIDIYFWWQSSGSGGGFALSSSTVKELSHLCDFMSFTFVQ